MQSRQSSDNDDEELSATAAATYKKQSSDIVDAFNDLLEKAQPELEDTRASRVSVVCPTATFHCDFC